MFKKCKIELLQNSNSQVTEKNQLYLATELEPTTKYPLRLSEKPNTSTSYNKKLKRQELYIISDEEIKEGDWCYERSTNSIIRCLNLLLANEFKYLQKVISSTDKSLNIYQPSQGFINKYIEEYNKGSIINEVMVEYEEYHGINKSIAEIYAVSQSDQGNDYNTITIKKVKDSWNKEEVIKLINKVVIEVKYPETYYDPCNSDEENDNIFNKEISQWINNNL